MKSLCALLLFSTFNLVAAERPRPDRVENRFLFIVETSSALSKSASAVHQVVSSLVRSGMQGQMKPGDTFGLWTFNDQLHPIRLPVQRWSPASASALDQQVTKFLDAQKYEKESNLDCLLAPLFSIVRNSRALTIILVSEGRQAFDGIPFSDEIYERYRENYSALQKVRLPFVTALVAREGEIVAYGVSSALPPIRIPNPPLPQRTTNATPKSPSVQELEKDPPAKRTKSEDAPTTTSPAPKTTETKVATPMAPTNTSVSAAPANSTVQPSNTLAPIKTALATGTATVVTSPPPPFVADSSIVLSEKAASKISLPQTNPISLSVTAVSSAPVRGNTHAVENSGSDKGSSTSFITGRDTNEVVMSQAAPRGVGSTNPTPVTSGGSPAAKNGAASTALITSDLSPPRFATGRILLVCGAVASIGLGFFWYQKRSRISKPSLISQSMDQSRK